MKKLKAVLRWTGRIFLVLLVILAVFILEENIRGQIMLSRYKAELRAKGERLTFEELGVPASSAGNESGRRLLDAEERLQQLGRECPFPIFFATYLHFVGPGRAVIRTSDPELRAGNVKLVARGDDREHVLGIGYRHAEWTDLAVQVARASNDLARLKAILARGDILLPVDLLHPSPELIRRRPDAVDWLGVEAMQALHEHDLDAVIGNVGVMMALLKVHEQLLSPKDQHKRCDAEDVPLFLTWHALQETLSDDQLTQLQRAWSVTNNSIEQTLLVDDIERARQLAVYHDTIRSPRRWWRLVHSTMRSRVEAPNPEPAPLPEYLAYNARALAQGVAWLCWNWSSDELRFLQERQKILEMSREVLRRRDFSYLMQQRDQPASASDAELGLLGQTLSADFPAFETVRFETRRELALTAIAIQRYHLRSGHPPDSLDELFPQFLPESPHDWFGGRPLSYRRNDGNFILYSVGTDGNDDGGDAGFPGERASFWTGKDIVWPQPVPPL